MKERAPFLEVPFGAALLEASVQDGQKEAGTVLGGKRAVARSRIALIFPIR